MWEIGAQCGLKPDEVLDMTLPMFRAFIRGYDDHMFSLQRIAVISGFYSGYYMSSKPKPLDQVLQQLDDEYTFNRNGGTRQAKVALEKEAMDQQVALFQEREERLRRFLNGNR